VSAKHTRKQARLPDRLPHDRGHRVAQDQEPQGQDRDRLLEEVDREEHGDEQVRRAQERRILVVPEQFSEEMTKDVPDAGIVEAEHLDRERDDHRGQKDLFPGPRPGAGAQVIGDGNGERSEMDGLAFQLGR
jgi:hypothetical protein